MVTDYCSDCQCLGGVIPASKIGNGICNDEVNIADCNYDGGDCCGQVDKKYCADCICHEDMENNAAFQTRSIDDLHSMEEGNVCPT